MPRDPAVLFVAALSLAAGYGLGEWPGFWLVCAALCLVALAAVAVVRGSVPDEPPLYPYTHGLCLGECAEGDYPGGAPTIVQFGRCTACGSSSIAYRSRGLTLPPDGEFRHAQEIERTRAAVRGRV